MTTLNIYYVDDSDDFETIWSDSEDVQWNEDGSATLKDGRIARQRLGIIQPNIRNRVDHASDALAVNPDEVRKYHKEDKKISKYSAPDNYDSSGRPHWLGSGLSVRHRVKAYAKERGMCKRDEF